MLRKIVRIIFKTLLLVIGAFGLYLIAAFTLPFVPVNRLNPVPLGGIKIAVFSNGVHTDLVVPAKTKQKDWTLTFPTDSFDVIDSLHSCIAFGWGDKGFYLDTPQWSDLTASTALKASLGLGGSAMHVSYRKERKKKSEFCEIITLTTEQYDTLVRYIENSFTKEQNHLVRIPHPGYGDCDRFYEAKGKYSLFSTCNTWTCGGLKISGLKTGWWCPFANGLMQSIRQQ